MTRIERLSQSVVNKIAAGEVIERPASVVKELLENAIDAGATRIDVAIEQGGSQLVRIADNGHGITAEQLPLAVASHATSKIRQADDLFHVETLGFRGEALASIAEISQFVIRSRAHDQMEGAQLEVAGGVVGEVIPCGGTPGTVIEVRNLFFNTPVRRKFLRGVQTEMGHITEALTRIALAHDEVHFTLRHNERSLIDLPAGDWRSRITTLLGHDIGEVLLPVESVEGPIKLRGYVADPSLSRSHNRMQYVFLNGRFIRDRSILHAITEAYRGLMMVGRYPVAFLRLTIPADAVDVNVHPTKLEVRFVDSGSIYGQLLATIRSRFLTTDLTARVRPEAMGSTMEAARPSEHVAGVGGGGEPARQIRLDLPHPPPTPLPLPTPSAMREFVAAAAPAGSPAATPEPGGETRWASPTAESYGGSGALQIHNRYLVTECDEGVVVVDQHALHERILYEELRERVLKGSVESQRLLVPETVTLSPAEAACVLEHQDLLAQMGIEVQAFGGDTILVSSYPAMLANLGPCELLHQLANHLLIDHKAPERRDLLDEMLHTVACKAAIKAGDRLAPEEVAALLQRRHLVQDAHHCPHGRPTALIFTREELDRRFKRTGPS